MTASEVNNKQPKQQQQPQPPKIEKAKKVFSEDFDIETTFRWMNAPSSSILIDHLIDRCIHRSLPTLTSLFPAGLMILREYLKPDGTIGLRSMRGWYERTENNGWRPISERILVEEDPVTTMTKLKRMPFFHFSPGVRRWEVTKSGVASLGSELQARSTEVGCPGV